MATANNNTHSATLASASTQYFTAIDSVSLSITGDYTIECWVKFTTTSTVLDARQTFISKPDNTEAAYGAYQLEIIGTGTGHVQLRGVSGAGVDELRYTWDPSTGTWYHVAYTRNSATGQQTLFVNGSQVAQITNTAGANADNTSKLFIGQLGGNTLKFNGQLDEVRIWNTVRTPTQVLNNYASRLLGTESNLQAYWTLDNVLTDATANGNTLTNNNAATFTTDVPFVGGFSASDTQASTDAISFFGFLMSVADTQGSTDNVRVKPGFNNTGKSTSPAWSNTPKT